MRKKDTREDCTAGLTCPSCLRRLSLDSRTLEALALELELWDRRYVLPATIVSSLLALVSEDLEGQQKDS